MSATLDYNSLKIEATGSETLVPNNNLAKLMYYLSCVFAVIQYNEDNKFSDYKHYYNLSKEDEKSVIVLALLLNPKLFLDAHIFVIEPNLVPYGYNNEFYKITDQRIGVHVNEEIIIAGKAVRVLKIMACKEQWLNNNFYDPITSINKVSEYPSNNYTYKTENSCNGKKCCKCFFIFMCIMGLIGFIGSMTSK